MFQPSSEINSFASTAECCNAIAKVVKDLSCNILIVTGPTVSYKYALKLLEGLDYADFRVISVTDYDLKQVSQLEEFVRENSIQAIIAVGGGTVGDIGKRLGLLTNTLLYLVPTIIANDGLISPVSVLSSNGLSISLPGRMPDKVFIDFAMLKSAPVKFIRAAALDILSNISATNDWQSSKNEILTQHENMAFRFSRMAADMLLDCNDWSYTSPVFTRVVLDAQILSGFAMCYAGSSRPCSGSEHLFGHAINQCYPKLTHLHGEIIGSTSRFCLHLQGYQDVRVEKFFKFHRVGKRFLTPKFSTVSEFEALIKIARRVRPGRETILDSYSNSELVRNYQEFLVDG